MMHPDTVKLLVFFGVSAALSAFFFLSAPQAPHWLEAALGGHHAEHPAEGNHTEQDADDKADAAAKEKHEKHMAVAAAMFYFLGIATALASLLGLSMGLWSAVRLDKMRGQEEDKHAIAH